MAIFAQISLHLLDHPNVVAHFHMAGMLRVAYLGLLRRSVVRRCDQFLLQERFFLTLKTQNKTISFKRSTHIDVDHAFKHAACLVDELILA